MTNLRVEGVSAALREHSDVGSVRSRNASGRRSRSPAQVPEAERSGPGHCRDASIWSLCHRLTLACKLQAPSADDPPSPRHNEGNWRKERHASALRSSERFQRSEWERGAPAVDRDSTTRQSADAIINRATTHGQLYPASIGRYCSTPSRSSPSLRSIVAECPADLTDWVLTLTPPGTDLRIDLATAGLHPRPPGQTKGHGLRPIRSASVVSAPPLGTPDAAVRGPRPRRCRGPHEDPAHPVPRHRPPRAPAGAVGLSSFSGRGEDTGHASNRAVVFQQLPTVSPRCPTREIREAYTEDMVRTGVIEGFDECAGISALARVRDDRESAFTMTTRRSAFLPRSPRPVEHFTASMPRASPAFS